MVMAEAGLEIKSDTQVARDVAKSYEKDWVVDHFQHSLEDDTPYEVIPTHNMYRLFVKRGEAKVPQLTY